MKLVTILGLGVQISIFLTVLSLGMRASLGDILHLFRRPGELFRALLSMYVIMPVFAILVVKIFALNPVIEVVLVALSVSPIPPAFPKKAFKSGGEGSFTFGLLAAVSLLSVIVIPLAFGLFDAVFKRETEFSELFIVNTILTKVVLPMVIGMAIRYFAPAFSERIGDTLAKIGGILLIVSVLPILIFLLPTIWSLIGNHTLPALVSFALVGAAAGYFLGGPNPKERTILALATSSRHPGIAIALASANVDETPKKLVAAAVILYLIVSAAVMAPFLKWLSGDGATENAVEREAV
jgi:BASS family bile acid:Na+ symporter